MSNNLDLARQYALDLARTLMVSVTLFKGDLGYGALPTVDFDGEPDWIICEYDPFG